MAKQFWKPGNMLYPLPAVMVTCKRPGEKPNIITLAWVGTVCSDPCMVSISVRPERYSYNIIKDTKEFVINLTTKDLVRQTDFCGVKSGRNVDKFKETGLSACTSKTVLTPGIAESPVNIECKVCDIKELGSHTMFLANVTAVGVEDGYLDSKNKFQLNQTGLMVYSHGEYIGLGKKLGTFGYSVKKKK